MKPFVEISCEAATSYALANLAGNARARGDTERAAALLEESAARFAAAGDDTRAGDRLRPPRLRGVRREGDLTTAREQLEFALDLRTALATGAAAGSCSPVSGWSRRSRATTTPRSVTSPRRGTSSGAPATGGGSRARSGGPRISRSRADNLDGAEAALQEAFAVLGETQRERWIANTLAGLAEVALLRGDVEQASRYFVEARDRYAARDDALGARAHRRTAGSACKVTAKRAQSAAR